MPSIFRTHSFDRWVVTHSLAVSDFHGHRPIVNMNECLLWYSLCFLLALYLNVRFIPHRQSCLPDLADSKCSYIHIVSVIFNNITILLCSFIVWQDVDRLTPPLHLIIIFTNQYYYHFDLPKGIFRWNQLLDGSMSLSPLNSNIESNLHVNTSWFFHQSFLRLQILQV